MTCACGCGQQTRLAARTDTKHGRVKGQPMRFLLGHSANLRRVAVTKDYRRVSVNGCKKHLHIQRAEAALGKPLPKGAEVHHADGSKSDDAPLVICEGRAYHFLLHARMRIKRAGGNPNTESLCSGCRSIKPLSAFSLEAARFNGRDRYCRDCSNAKEKIRRDKRRVEYDEMARMIERKR